MDSGTGRDAGGHSARERILDSGLHLFAEKGFTGATTKEISAKAGVNEVTLFRHFGSKKALFASVIQERSHLPVFVDPSHAAGDARYVAALARAAVAGGADGIIVEVHPCPSAALCDDAQALTPEAFGRLVEELKGIRAVLKAETGGPDA